MAYIIALTVLSLASVVASIWLIRSDGYRRIPADPERVARRREASRSARSNGSPASVSTVQAATAPLPAAASPARATSVSTAQAATAPLPAGGTAEAPRARDRSAAPDTARVSAEAATADTRTLAVHAAG